MKQPTSSDDEAAGRALRRPLRELSVIEGLADPAGSGGHPVTCSRDEHPEGPEFNVETVTRNGMHHVIGITHPRHAPPAETERAVLRSAVMALLDLAGHESGSARTVVVLTARGPRIAACELHTS